MDKDLKDLYEREYKKALMNEKEKLKDVYKEEYQKALEKEIKAKAKHDAQRKVRGGNAGKKICNVVGKAVWKFMSTPPKKPTKAEIEKKKRIEKIWFG